MAEYTKEQFWKLYEKLPQELKDAIFSEETANSIGTICERNKIEDEKVSEVAKYAGRVLLGVLPPSEFSVTLEKEVGLEEEAAKKVAQQINRFIFYPVKPNLEQLYKMEITPSAKTEEIKPVEEKPEAPTGKDTYRETIE